MKRLIVILFVLLGSVCRADDTATVQAAVSSGTLTKGTYNISSTITIGNSFNGNGSTINYTASTGKAFNVTASSITIQNFHFTGISDSSNPSGATAIGVIGHDHVSILNVQANFFSGYGFYFQDSSYPDVEFSNVYDTGYIGMFFYIFTAGTYHGGILNTDTINRSMLSNTLSSGTTQGAFQIKGIVTTGNYTGWTISNMVVSMPSNPVDWTAEITEINAADSVTVTNIKGTGGSIGGSFARCNRFRLLGSNTFDGQNQEGIELVGTTHSYLSGYSIINQLHDGILIDPAVSPSMATATDTLISGTVTNPARFCINVTQTSASVFVSGNTFTCSYIGPCIEMGPGDGITFYNCSFLGASSATYWIELNNSTGNISATNCTVSNFTASHVLHATTAGTASADYVNFRCMTYSGVTLGLNIFGSYTIGSNVNLSLACTVGGKLMLYSSGAGKLIIFKH